MSDEESPPAAPDNSPTATSTTPGGGATSHPAAPVGAPAAVPAGTPEPDLSADHLPCGRLTDDLIDLVLDGRAAPPHDERDTHQRTCVHCLALAAETDRLWEPVRASAAVVHAPPPDLLNAVMTKVRELGKNPEHLVIPGTHGATKISADAVRQIAERAAAEVPDVALTMARARHARPELGDLLKHPESDLDRVDVGEANDPGKRSNQTVGLAGQYTAINLAVMTVYGASIPTVAAQVRQRVRQALQSMTTATNVRVDIYVDDITHARQ